MNLSVVTTKLEYIFQFYRKEPEDGLISPVDFADLLLAYAGLPEKIQHRMIRRVKKKFKGSTQVSIATDDSSLKKYCTGCYWETAVHLKHV